MINLLFWICNGVLGAIASTSAASGFWDVFALALCGIATNVMVFFVYNSKK